jgi:hypothetical protein
MARRGYERPYTPLGIGWLAVVAAILAILMIIGVIATSNIWIGVTLLLLALALLL